MGILIKNTISKSSKAKIKIKKDPLKFQEINNIEKDTSNKKVVWNRPPKVGIMIEEKFQNFQKPKIN